MVKKRLIMDVALELFAKQGFEATSIQQITEDCGISKGAFYLSFKSKTELVLSLIDHFSMKTISAFDQLVRSTAKEELLYTFYHASYRHMDKYADFMMFFIKEAQAFNKKGEINSKIHYYNKMQDEIILTILERVYGDSIEPIKIDLLYSVRSFLNMYAEVILFKNIKLDFDLLAKSLVEKTDLLAKGMKIPFLTESNLQWEDYEIDKEKLIEIVDRTIGKLADSIIKESLLLLQAELEEPSLPEAVISGLIANIAKEPSYEWIAALLEGYFVVE